jgi:hypothetical protein
MVEFVSKRPREPLGRFGRQIREGTTRGRSRERGRKGPLDRLFRPGTEADDAARIGPRNMLEAEGMAVPPEVRSTAARATTLAR